MDYQSLLFIGFVALNTVFSYKAGKNEGLFQGMISITQFYKDKSALKDKQSILGFEKWPEITQAMFLDPNPNNFED